MIVYENEGHRQRLIRDADKTMWKWYEFRLKPYCRNCCREMHMSPFGSWKSRATLDHIIARCLGGDDDEWNWELICGKCNNDKAKVETKLLKEMQNGKLEEANKSEDAISNSERSRVEEDMEATRQSSA